MARQELELAKELISEKQYDKARMLLMKVKDDPTAQKWLEKLDELAPIKAPETSSNGHHGDGDVSPWQYAALEVKRAYGIQYKVNGESRLEWKDQPIYFALNQLGREGWEMISFESINEFSVYILKRPGIAAVKKIDVWDQ
ncbi:MAG: hypothetical protein LCI00_00960 [Chloroflexi bacterium]|nr:hypothetical protein [Chloroflexota bacterium]MCC6897001.1 hypothetical protein [Anaerolineae bacterium]